MLQPELAHLASKSRAMVASSARRLDSNASASSCRPRVRRRRSPQRANRPYVPGCATALAISPVVRVGSSAAEAIFSWRGQFDTH